MICWYFQARLIAHKIRKKSIRVIEKIKCGRPFVFFFETLKNEIFDVFVEDEVETIRLDAIGALFEDLVVANALLVGSLAGDDFKNSHAERVDVDKGTILFFVNFRSHELRSA